jgi:hypothetical protein
MPSRKRRVVLGFLGTTLDTGAKAQRWTRWRPTVSMCRHPDLPIDRVELWHGPNAGPVLAQVTADLAEVAPATQVVPHLLTIRDPWDFEEVFAALFEFARSYAFDPPTRTTWCTSPPAPTSRRSVCSSWSSRATCPRGWCRPTPVRAASARPSAARADRSRPRALRRTRRAVPAASTPPARRCSRTASPPARRPTTS